jgi:CheY-like chemotaxis protein
MALLLGLYGFNARTACDGFQALTEIQSDCLDVVLLDISLPKMDGYETARRIRQQQNGNGKRPLLVAISGYGSEQDRQRSHEAGIDMHFVKPVDPPELEKLLRRFQKIVAPAAAERRLPAHQRPDRSFPHLKYLSDRALLKEFLRTARETQTRAAAIRTQRLASSNREERLQRHGEWCRQLALFLDESRKVQQVITSHQKWGLAP